jgi:hypothetical protein
MCYTSLSTNSAYEESSVAMMMLMLNNQQPVLPISTSVRTFPRLTNKRPLSLSSKELLSPTIAMTDAGSYIDVGVSSKHVKLPSGGFRMPSLQSNGKANQVLKPVSLTSFKSIWSSADHSQDVSRELFARRLYRGGGASRQEQAMKPILARNDFRLPSLGNTNGEKKPTAVKKSSSSLKYFRQVWSMAKDKEVAREMLSRKMQKGRQDSR